MIVGPDTRFVLSTVSQRQSAVSHSTPEAEIVALDHVVRILTIPDTTLMEQVLGRPVETEVCEDNETCWRVCTTGNNPTMRHLERTHRVDVAWLHEQHEQKVFKLSVIGTKAQVADIFTKPITNQPYWTSVTELIQVVNVGEYWLARETGGGGCCSHPFQKFSNDQRQQPSWC